MAVVMGGIWGGVFTPSEAGALGAFAALVIALGRRRLTMRHLLESLRETASSAAMIFAIVIGAMVFGYFLTLTGLPKALADFVGSLAVPPLVILLVIILMYMILGCIMDTLAMTLITIPIIFPLIVSAGYSPILFGVIFVIMGELALITPPIGMNVFVIAGMAKDIPMYTIFRGIAPFIAPMLVCTALVIAFPQLALFLPHTMLAK
jgi:tripartite ATP-independent transporter DctM subunit